MSAGNVQSVLLNVGQEPWLLHTRELLLRSAGYIVESAHSVEDAIHRFRAGDFDLVILCHSVPAEERQRLVCLIRDHGSSTPVIFVAAGARGSSVQGIPSDPVGLLNAVKQTLETDRSRQR